MTDTVDRARRVLPPGSYYVFWHSARYLQRRQRGICFLVYFRNLADGYIYRVAVTYGSPGFLECRDCPQDSIMFVTIGHSKNGHMVFQTLEPVYKPGPVVDNKAGMKALDLHICASRKSHPLRIPFLRRLGVQRRPNIMIVAPWPTVHLSRSHFASDDELRASLLDVQKFRAVLRTLGDNPNEYEVFETQIERLFWIAQPEPVIPNLLRGGVVIMANTNHAAVYKHFGIEIPPPQPVPTLYYTWLCPSPFPKGGRAARKGIPPAELELGAELLRLAFRRFRPDIVLVSGTETVRRLPEILRRLPHRTPYQLHKMRAAYQRGMTLGLTTLIQEFGETKKWRSEFVPVPDLRYFGQPNIHRQKLRRYLWGHLLFWLKCTVYACIQGTRFFPDDVKPMVKPRAPIDRSTVGV